MPQLRLLRTRLIEMGPFSRHHNRLKQDLAKILTVICPKKVGVNMSANHLLKNRVRWIPGLIVLLLPLNVEAQEAAKVVP